MKSYAHLCGLQYEWGVNDCYTAMQRFYKDVYDVTLRDYIRPQDFGVNGINLYMDNYMKEGFRLIDVPMHDLLPGDAFVIQPNVIAPVNGPDLRVPTHAAAYVGGSQIFHHYTGQLSGPVPYKGLWRTRTVATLRHPDVAKQYMLDTKINLIDMLPQHLKEKVIGPQPAPSPDPAVET